MIFLQMIVDAFTEKSERSQAYARSALLTAATIYFFFAAASVFPAAVGVTAISYLWIWWTSAYKNIKFRKVIGILFDQAAISTSVWLMGPLQASTILIYFWVILGSGYRYGSIYSLIASGASIVGLTTVVLFAPLWVDSMQYGFEFIIGHVLVSLFAFKLLYNLEHAISDIARIRKRATDSEIKAMTDSLTGLYNREFALNWLRQASSNDIHIGVLFVDLDNFKQFNDQYGHHVGDEVLINIGKRLLHSIRPDDVVCRYAGDEFVILINDGSHKVVDEVANRVRSSLDTKMHVGDISDLTVTGSVGVAMLGVHSDDVDEVLKQADTAMYVAKHTGRNHVAWFDEEITK